VLLGQAVRLTQPECPNYSLRMAKSFHIPLARLEPGESTFDGSLDFTVLDAAAEEEPFEVKVDCHVDNRGARVQVEVKIAGVSHSHCHSCLELFDRKVSGGFDVILERSDKDLGDEIIQVSEDLVEYDLTPMVIEAMIIEEPIQLRCREDCLGLCGQCGKNLNEGTCSCSKPEDSRWEGLKKLASKLDPESGS
jgi:uncharacterized protein